MNLNRVRKIDGRVRVKNALVSVADKSGLDEFVLGLVETCPGVHVYSTGGTYAVLEKSLAAAGKASALRQVSEYTGQPEMQGGLVKTLDYRIYLGLLSETYNPSHEADLKRLGAETFDLVCVNLYPFREAASAAGAVPEDARTHIDIGGPCMLRAAAKNFLRVAAVCDPGDYPALLAELKTGRAHTELSTRFKLAKKVFRHTADYDAAIADYFASLGDSGPAGIYDVQ
jgi:phosphoribosylaminoimidazolecarboxamide formyltransferase/IMP cyclohydrolase